MNTIPNILNDLLQRFLLFLPKLIVALVLFVITLALTGVIKNAVLKILKQRKATAELSLLITRLTQWSVLTFGTIVALQQINFNLTAFLTGLGILGFTIGFAVQDVSKNFIAGVLLLLQQPFDIGDAIEVGKFSGTVVTVDLRATELLTLDGKNVLIPNADVYTSAIIHFSKAKKRRIELSAGVAYESDLDFVNQTAVEAISAIDGVLPDPAPAVVYNNLGPSTIDLTLYYWVNTAQIGILDAKDAGIRAIKMAFEEAKIEMPYPIQTVMLKEKLSS